jgi:hypothetical protein
VTPVAEQCELERDGCRVQIVPGRDTRLVIDSASGILWLLPEASRETGGTVVWRWKFVASTG